MLLIDSFCSVWFLQSQELEAMLLLTTFMFFSYLYAVLRIEISKPSKLNLHIMNLELVCVVGEST
jgi:hypothetical protein